MINQRKKPPGKGSGPSGNHPARATNTTTAVATSNKHDRLEDSRRHDQVMAHALLCLAVPGALYDRALVRSCPICGYAHIHNLLPGEARTVTVIRHPRCAPHRSYSLEITGVVPASAVPGQRRRRAAA